MAGRQQPKVTQSDLSARVEAYDVRIDRLGIGRVEAGKRIVLDFERRAIAAALYVPMSWLIGEEAVWGSAVDIPSARRSLVRHRRASRHRDEMKSIPVKHEIVYAEGPCFRRRDRVAGVELWRSAPCLINARLAFQ